MVAYMWLCYIIYNIDGFAKIQHFSKKIKKMRLICDYLRKSINFAVLLTPFRKHLSQAKKALISIDHRTKKTPYISKAIMITIMSVIVVGV